MRLRLRAWSASDRRQPAPRRQAAAKSVPEAGRRSERPSSRAEGLRVSLYALTSTLDIRYFLVNTFLKGGSAIDNACAGAGMEVSMDRAIRLTHAAKIGIALVLVLFTAPGGLNAQS